MTEPATELELLTDTDVAEILGITVKTLQQWRWKGIGPAYIKVGQGWVRYRPTDVSDWLEENRYRNKRRDVQI